MLFELYWIFRILDAYEGVRYHVLADQRDNSSIVASWEQDDIRYVVSHDSTGTGLSFNESLGSEAIQPDGYLYRMNEVLSRWQLLSEDLLDRGGGSTLWGGRPDIVVERYERDDGGWSLHHVFVGEVKYTQNVDYVASGLRELLEYMAFVRRASAGDYVEAPDDVLDSVRVKGLLFVDELGRDISSSGEIDIIQYPDSVGPVV